MIKYLLLFLLPFSLYASKILSYNIYDRTDRVDIMITFDTPYDGVIKQSVSESTITIKLEDATIESAKIKQLSSKYIKSLSISPMSGHTKIIALVPPSVGLQASKTSDSYGLRLRFANKTVKQAAPVSNKQTNSEPLSLLPTKKSDDIAQSYYIVITILIIGIILLFFIKKKVTPKQNSKEPASWLFKENANAPKEVVAQAKTENANVSIRFQKSINNENSVVMLDFGEQSYLVLMGKSNILLDKFTDDRPVTQDDFDTILQSRHKELNDFLQDKKENNKEPLQAYKERAASIAYED
ncbi:MAG: hypothetical protein OQK48_04125 [Sulfurimonas sp.]|uniref:hypothetical protein n=1 Tax=Sulfurimonas sp. TaxID=2022749 RepID=UPI002639D9B3|nr:hypothetical protein [Sulfurimonas sp.]MCW8894490.1 hypothetical protein [Sulfurimonas sp.]MCW8954107.1 hypothetical protein [Sulfurimonas sp.]MCW9067829.1 hypothetical protein [Sulfurimonas sp.]